MIPVGTPPYLFRLVTYLIFYSSSKVCIDEVIRHTRDPSVTPVWWGRPRGAE